MKQSVTYSEWSVKAVENYINKAVEARNNAINCEKASTRPTFVEFSTNSKLCGIVTFGTLPIIDCGKACKDCKLGCYAVRHLAGRLSDKREQYARNSARLALNPEAYFQDIANRARLAVVMRWHESGEIINYSYFVNVVNVARQTPNCEHLIYTKRHDIINKWIAENGNLPENLHVLLSAWANPAGVQNPYNLPVSAPDFSGERVAAKYRKPFDANGLHVHNCTGDCSKCFLYQTGCFGAKGGEIVVFAAH